MGLRSFLFLVSIRKIESISLMFYAKARFISRLFAPSHGIILEINHEEGVLLCLNK